MTNLRLVVDSPTFSAQAPLIGDSVCSATPSAGIYTLSLHDALPISARDPPRPPCGCRRRRCARHCPAAGCRAMASASRSEEHTSELQSRVDLVCRLLLEKKNGLAQARRAPRHVLERAGGETRQAPSR